MKVKARNKKDKYKKDWKFQKTIGKRIDCRLKMKNPVIKKTAKVNGDKDYRKIKLKDSFQGQKARRIVIRKKNIKIVNSSKIIKRKGNSLSRDRSKVKEVRGNKVKGNGEIG